MATNTTPVIEYSCGITPSILRLNVDNGGYTTPIITADAFGGIGPFEYEWTVDVTNGEPVTLSASDKKSITATTGGYDSESIFKLTCTVTDTGNANTKVSSSSNCFITFGDNF